MTPPESQPSPVRRAPAALAVFFASRPSHSSRTAIRWLVSLGGIGLFGISLLDACPIPLPIPGMTDLVLLVLIVHRAHAWIMVPLAVGGSIVGALITWSVGKKGGEPALRRYVPDRYYERITRWTTSHGAVVVAVASVLPPPVPLMPFLIAAGALGMTKRRFLVALGAARVARYSLIAWLGVLYGRHMIRWWNRYLARYSSTISWTILALFIAALAWGIWKWKQGSRTANSAEVAAQAG